MRIAIEVKTESPSRATRRGACSSGRSSLRQPDSSQRRRARRGPVTERTSTRASGISPRERKCSRRKGEKMKVLVSRRIAHLQRGRRVERRGAHGQARFWTTG